MTFDELLQEHNVDRAPGGHHHARRGWIQIDCPFCSKGSHRWRMGYNTYARYVNCWTCGPHDLAETLSELIGEPVAAARRLLGDLERSNERERLERQKYKLVLPKFLGALLPAHKRYLKGRGYDWKEIQRLWKIRGFGMLGPYAWRIFIPVFSAGKNVSFTTRSISDTGIRYLSAPAAPKDKESETALWGVEEVDHKSLLYGEDYVRHGVVVHEGPLDVWRTGPGAVCTFGTGYKRAQVERLAKYPVRVVCFDNERDAQRRARHLCDQLEVFPGDTYNVVLKAKDAGSSGDKEIRRLRREFLHDLAV